MYGSPCEIRTRDPQLARWMVGAGDCRHLECGEHALMRVAARALQASTVKPGWRVSCCLDSSLCGRAGYLANLRLLATGMALDNCSACGEEHEPPRGTKCKRAKLPKRAIKAENVSSGEEIEAPIPPDTISAGVSASTSASATGGAPARRQAEVGDLKYSPEYEEDEEERALRKELAALACERRKQALRAALKEEMERSAEPRPVKVEKAEEVANASTDGTVAVLAAIKKEKKVKKKSTKKDCIVKADPDESPSDSSSAGDSSSSSDDSESGSESRTRRRRRRRSKYALNKFTPHEKRLKKLTVLELIYTALTWGIKRSEKVGMDFKLLRGYMGHIAYMCMHATTSAYTDRTYRSYDKAVRSKVKEDGLSAFSQGNMEISLLHFNHDNIRPVKEVRPAGRYGTNTRSFEKKICYAFNYSKAGCTVRKCDYDHKCLVCKSSDHAVEACRRKRY